MDKFVSMGRTALLFGRDQEQQIGRQLKYCDVTRVLVLVAQRAAEAGVDSVLRRVLEFSGIDYELRQISSGLPQTTEMASLAEHCRSEKINALLVAGDGNTICAAKAVCAAVPYRGTAREFFLKRAPADLALPLGVVVTVPGSGYELNDELLLSEPRKDGSAGFYDLQAESLIPRFTVLNPALCNCFPAQTGSVCANLLARALGLCLSDGVLARLSCASGAAVAQLVLEILPRIRVNPLDYELRANLLWAGVLLHNALNPGLRGAPELELPARELMLRTGCSHARAVALLMPAWLEFLEPKEPLLLMQLCHLLLNVPLDFAMPASAVRLALERLRQIFAAAGLPTTFTDLKLGGEAVGEILGALPWDEEGCLEGTVLSFTDVEVMLSLARLGGWQGFK